MGRVTDDLLCVAAGRVHSSDKSGRADRSLKLRVPTMTTFRIVRTLIASICLAVLVSGCHVTSMKVRASQPQPYEAQPGSGLLPIPQGAPPTFETPPSPVPPSPASASTARDFGVKTTAMFRSAGDKMKSAFEKMQ